MEGDDGWSWKKQGVRDFITREADDVCEGIGGHVGEANGADIGTMDVVVECGGLKEVGLKMQNVFLAAGGIDAPVLQTREVVLCGAGGGVEAVGHQVVSGAIEAEIDAMEACGGDYRGARDRMATAGVFEGLAPLVRELHAVMTRF